MVPHNYYLIMRYVLLFLYSEYTYFRQWIAAGNLGGGLRPPRNFLMMAPKHPIIRSSRYMT